MTEMLDAPVTTLEFDGDDSRPLQQLPTTETKAKWEQFALGVFIVVPLLGVLGAGFVLWGTGLSWLDIALSAVFYVITLHGITVGFHRYFTHGSFKAKRALRIALAVAGQLAIQGPVTRWVADHRRHHAYSDEDGDPHSPWRYGTGFKALSKGLWHAHIGWLFDVEQTDQRRFVPDLLADKDIRVLTKLFPAHVALSLLAPPLLGGLITWSWTGALTAFFWASVIRIGLLHHKATISQGASSFSCAGRGSTQTSTNCFGRITGIDHVSGASMECGSPQIGCWHFNKHNTDFGKLPIEFTNQSE